MAAVLIGLVLLARAAAESGQACLFDATASQCVQALQTATEQDVLFNPFTVREVRLRGLLATRRTAQAADLAGHCPSGSEPPSLHWRVIERVTTAEVLARAGDEHAAQTMLTAAGSDAESLSLPHQVQRVIRLASESGVHRTHSASAGAGSPDQPGKAAHQHSRTGRLRGRRPAARHHGR